MAMSWSSVYMVASNVDISVGGHPSFIPSQGLGFLKPKSFLKSNPKEKMSEDCKCKISSRKGKEKMNEDCKCKSTSRKGKEGISDGDPYASMSFCFSSIGGQVAPMCYCPDIAILRTS